MGHNCNVCIHSAGTHPWPGTALGAEVTAVKNTGKENGTLWGWVRGGLGTQKKVARKTMIKF